MSIEEEYSKSNKKIMRLAENKIKKIEHSLEYDRCKKSPYYFATKYLTINNKPFVTNYTEDEFNEMFFIMEGTKKYDKKCKTNL